MQNIGTYIIHMNRRICMCMYNICTYLHTALTDNPFFSDRIRAWRSSKRATHPDIDSDAKQMLASAAHGCRFIYIHLLRNMQQYGICIMRCVVFNMQYVIVIRRYVIVICIYVIESELHVISMSLYASTIANFLRIQITYDMYIS